MRGDVMLPPRSDKIGHDVRSKTTEDQETREVDWPGRTDVVKAAFRITGTTKIESDYSAGLGSRGQQQAVAGSRAFTQSQHGPSCSSCERLLLVSYLASHPVIFSRG